jgi:DNA ligase-4
VLVLDGASLLRTPYAARRAALESLVQPIPQRALLATRTPVDFGPGAEAGTAQLRAAFAALVADHEEGAVLKADNGLYNDWRYPWVKVSAFLWADGGAG